MVPNPDDPKTTPPDPKTPGGEWVPPRVRAKLYDELEDEEEKKSRSMQNIVGILMLVLVVGLGGLLLVMMNRGQAAEK